MFVHYANCVICIMQIIVIIVVVIIYFAYALIKASLIITRPGELGIFIKRLHW